ncbi:MAG TPA: hypothetical protein VN690_13610 [Terriglobales bacterium]|nr:hypothetical protein [Terriglobales bacterium]
MHRSALLIALASACVAAAQVPASMYSSLQWRLIGPLRGGKATAVAGVAGNPAVYYMGTAGSGAWKTSDGGRTWQCISDSARLTGIGAVAVMPVTGKPAVVYVGASGGGPSAGLYRSEDGGRTLALVALGGHAVSAITIDPRDPNQVLAAATDTGVVRSGDGGRSWTTVLAAADAGGGAVALAPSPDDARVVYAGVRAAFGGRGARAGGGAGRGAAAPAPNDPPVFRSHDGGKTWTKTAGNGLPASRRGTIGLAVAPGHRGDQVFAYVAQGVFRSDDGGGHWKRATDDPRLIGGGQFFHIYVSPVDDTVLYAMQTSVYRSTDAGKTWESFTGAPSGDDFNALWIDPSRPLDMALAVDQGTEISMNGGKSWTTWYNQPTGQMYNVSVDQRFPFFMYASQQDSGTVAVPIRGNDGEISYRDWYTTNGFETARITPDPLHANILYVTGWYGSVLRVDHSTGQTVHVFERNAQYRESGSPYMEFSPQDPSTLYLATQYVLETQDAGMHWKAISPDLTGGGRGAISTLAPSPRQAGEIWAGTSDGRVQLTQDGGGHWRNVTPAGAEGAITMIEPGRAEGETAYAVLAGRRGFGRGGAPAAASAVPAPPRIERTSDNGKTWVAADAGLPTGAVHAVREDPVNPELLFAAMDSGVYVSFDDGRNWGPLELNLPAASCRDLAIEQNTLVVATYGRGLWALDDIGSLRQMSGVGARAVQFFAPTPAIRLQWDTYTDTPLNPETATSPNPPDGAILDYYLPSVPQGPIKLQIFDGQGNLVREFSSAGEERLPYKINVPDYWLAPPSLLPKHAGLNRFVWNLRYPDPPYLLYTYFGIHTNYYEYTLADHAIPGNTPWHEPQGPMVLPGTYMLKLTVNGQTSTQPLTVTLDPRVTGVSQADLERQLAVAQELVAGLKGTTQGYDAIAAAAKAQPELQKYADQLGTIDRDQARILIGVTQADAAPGAEVVETANELCQRFNAAVASWNLAKPEGAAALQALGCSSSSTKTELYLQREKQ